MSLGLLAAIVIFVIGAVTGTILRFKVFLLASSVVGRLGDPRDFLRARVLPGIADAGKRSCVRHSDARRRGNRKNAEKCFSAGMNRRKPRDPH